MTMFGGRKGPFVHLDHAASQSGSDGGKKKSGVSASAGPASEIIGDYCQECSMNHPPAFHNSPTCCFLPAKAAYLYKYCCRQPCFCTADASTVNWSHPEDERGPSSPRKPFKASHWSSSLQIFRCLTVRDLLSCARVCCKWKSVIQNGALWSQVLDASVFPPAAWPRLISRVVFFFFLFSGGLLCGERLGERWRAAAAPAQLRPLRDPPQPAGLRGPDGARLPQRR